MAIKEHPNSKIAEQSLPQDATAPAQSVDESRRRFGKSGLAASGVILTLASQPVLGQLACQSPSGFQSGNVSPHGQPLLCMGRTPGYWGERPEEWPKPPYDPGSCATRCNIVDNWTGGTLFGRVFTRGGGAAGYSHYSMMQVIHLNGNQDGYQLGAHIVAALLNAQMGWTPVLTEQAVKDMFNEWASSGVYHPTAGVDWYAADIIAYLKTTMS